MACSVALRYNFEVYTAKSEREVPGTVFLLRNHTGKFCVNRQGTNQVTALLMRHAHKPVAMTLVLLPAVISLAWYIEFSSRHQQQLVGNWVWPTAEHENHCASFRLMIRDDHTFTKYNYVPAGVFRFDGVYEHLSNGQVRFQLTDFTQPEADSDALSTELGDIRHEFWCRYAIDPDGQLLLTCIRRHSDLDPEFDFEEIYSQE